MSNIRKGERVHPKLSDKKLVDQSHKNMCDINIIMERYRKTGMLPQFREKIPYFVDNTGIKSIEEAHELVNEANYLFEQIPSHIRKLMDNNPANLVDFIKNPENIDVCTKYGLIEPQSVAPDKVAAGKASEDLEKETKDTK